MKVQVFLCIVALCAAQASAVTLGEAVASLCSPALDALQSPDFSSLNAALDAASTVDVGDIPSGELVVVAPTNAAFSQALEALGTTIEDVASNTELLTSILAVHVAVATDLESETAGTLAGNQLMFMSQGKEVGLETLGGDTVAGTGSVMGPLNSANVGSIISCPDEKQTILVADSVLLPTALAPGPTVAPEPEAPEPSAPAGGSEAASIGMAAMVSLFAAFVL
eukprot:jgi/Picsp_1/1016/NSC_04500-R1_major secreted immunogenic protein mpt70